MLDEAAVNARLKFLWSLVDEASASGEWSAVEMSRLDEWPTVLTTEGHVLSVSKARSKNVLRGNTFEEDAKAREAMCRFGVEFAVHDALYLTRKVCSGPERLAAALEAASKERKEAGGERDFPLDQCLALRSVILIGASSLRLRRKTADG